MYQRKVDVDMLEAVRSVLADVSSVSPSSEQRTLKCLKHQPTHSLRHSAYPHQLYVDTFCYTATTASTYVLYMYMTGNWTMKVKVVGA